MQSALSQETKRWSRFDLTGTWRLNTGETIVITHSGNIVTAAFSPTQPCYSDVRTTLFISPLEYEVIERDTVVYLKSEQFWACSGNEKLCKDCDIPVVYLTKFDAEITPDGAMIDGRRIAHYIRYEEKDGKYTNCRRDESGDEWRTFSLTRSERSCDDLQRAYDQKKGLLEAHDAETEMLAKEYNDLYDKFTSKVGEAEPLINNASSEWTKSNYDKWLSDNFNSIVVPLPPSIISLPLTAFQNVMGFFSYYYQTHNATLAEVRTWAQNQPPESVKHLLRLLDYLDEMKAIANQMFDLKNHYEDKMEHREPLERAMNEAKKELDACLGKQ
jgi:hypothetical protein